MSLQAPAPSTLATLRHALTELQAGRFWQTLPVFESGQTGDSTQARILHAFCLAGTGQPDAAATMLCQIAQHHPTEQHPLQDLVDLMAAQDRRPEAQRVGQAALQYAPQDIRLYEIQASLLVQLGQMTDAITLLQHALTLRPGNVQAHNLLAMALVEQGAMDDALATLHAALAIQPDHAGTLSNIGTILTGMGRLEEALEHFRRAISQRPDEARIRLNHSISLLKAGRYHQGWTEHEWRLHLPGHTHLPPERLLPSLGPDTSLHGSRVLVTQEEGLGDTLMYLRYVPLLAERGAEVHVQVPATLAALCRRIPGVQAVHDLAATPAYDWHCPFISLPRVFAATSTPWGKACPYLQADPEKVKALAHLLPDNGRMNVGLVWGGAQRPTLVAPNIIDRRRSMSLPMLAPLTTIRGINLISLQKGPYAEQMMDPPQDMVLYDPTDDLHSMDDTAALIMSLDVVVSVDTSVAHLAGALGKPVLLMDRYDNCWRWLHGRTDTPWYPTLSIARQTTPRQWDTVVDQVVRSLTSMAANRS